MPHLNADNHQGHQRTDQYKEEAEIQTNRAVTGQKEAFDDTVVLVLVVRLLLLGSRIIPVRLRLADFFLERELLSVLRFSLGMGDCDAVSQSGKASDGPLLAHGCCDWLTDRT